MSGRPKDDAGELQLAGDPIAGSTIEQLFLTETPRLTHYFRRRIGNREDVLDLVQETFARMVGARPSEQLRNPQAYLQRIARNLLVNRSKRTETKLAARHVPFGEDVEISVPPDQSYAIEAEDLRRKYRQAVQALTPRTREVFLLHRVNALSYKEIAARLGISVSTVEYHLARALVHIDRALRDA